MNKKISKVSIEYEDGGGIYVDGEDASKWQVATEGLSVLAYTRGIDFPLLDWKKLHDK